MIKEKILITGGTGFIGQELIKKLANEGKYELHELKRYVTSRYSLDASKSTTVHYTNLTDYPAIKNTIKLVQPDYVIHLGAISPVSFSYDHFIEVTEANYLGTINLAEACYREVPNFKQFLFASTSEEYGMTLRNPKGKLYEDSELKPNSPYAVAKVGADLYLRYMHEAYGFPATIIRPFNTYGRKDNTHFFIERTISQMLSGDTVYLGDATTVRDWLYVDDHVRIYQKALNNPQAIGQVIQACTGKGYTTRQSANIIAKMIGFKGKIIWNSTPRRPLDAQNLVGDNRKAKRLLAWSPQYTFKEGLEKTIDYWKQQMIR